MRIIVFYTSRLSWEYVLKFLDLRKFQRTSQCIRVSCDALHERR